MGRIGRFGCNLVMRSSEMRCAYVQVAMTVVNDRSTEDRECCPLEQIRDDWPKFAIARNIPIQCRVTSCPRM